MLNYCWCYDEVVVNVVMLFRPRDLHVLRTRNGWYPRLVPSGTEPKVVPFLLPVQATCRLKSSKVSFKQETV